MSVPKIIEITYAWNSVGNMSEEKSTTRQGLTFSDILPLHVLPPSPQSNNLAWAREPMEKPVPG